MEQDLLSASAIAESVFEVEQRLDLSRPSWSEGDVHWWPLYRISLYRELFVQQARAASTNERRTWSPLLRRVNVSDDRRNVQVAFLSDGISIATIAGSTVDRFCSPLAHSLGARGIESEILDRGSLEWRSLSQTAPTHWIAPVVLRAKVLATLLSGVRTSSRHQDCCSQVNVALRELGRDSVRFQPRIMSAYAAAVGLISGWTQRLIEKRCFEYLFIVNYYDIAGFAACLASARAGIVSVDVQHGVGGRWHPAYANWSRVPRAGYALLPKRFWAWTSEDVDIINEWTVGPSPVHRGVLGGNPYLDAWRTGEISADAADLERLSELGARAGDRPIVLVTLQPDLASGTAILPLVKLLESHPAVAWWFRLHPTAAGDRSEVISMLRDLCVQHWDIDLATRLPLPMLLARASVHLTHSSSAVLESEAMGVPSIIWSQYGAQLFEGALKRGTAMFATNADAFVALLKSASSCRIPDVGSQGSTDRGLDSLLGFEK